MKTARVLAAGFARAVGFIKATITQQPESKKPTTDHIAIRCFMALLLRLAPQPDVTPYPPRMVWEVVFL
jgi:hypothetical protein